MKDIGRKLCFYVLLEKTGKGRVLDEWYVLHIGFDEHGNFVSGYCDIVLPTTQYRNVDKEMVYTDLYVDVVVRKDFSVYTKDQEAFERAARTYPIVAQSRQQSFATLTWVEQHAYTWTGPFAFIPRSLPRTDFHTLESEQAGTILRALC